MAQQNKVLVYTKNGEGYVHKNIQASVQALMKLGKENNFLVDTSSDPEVMTKENLKQYDALIFSNTNNETFNTDEQRLAFVHYIEAGGGFVGIHSACGSERNWPWFWSLLGGKFVRHPKFQEFTIKVIDKSHPATTFLDGTWQWEDECYYLNKLNPANHVLLAADLTTIEDDKQDEYPADIFGNLFPLAWCRKTDHGRVFYTALGHESEDYSDPTYLKHLLGGIEWVLVDKGDINYKYTTTSTIQKIEKNQK
jgi:type 1 glutamine amidotransferase